MTQIDPFLIAIGTLGVLVFIITSMVGMGFSLTIPQIMAPLKNRRLVLSSLVANFVLVPILVLLIARVLPLSEGLQIGLILTGMAAGAPFLPKLVQVAKGDMAFTAGLMVLLMVATVVYLPIVLPFVLTGVQVSPWEIAKSLIFLMLVPLAVALFVRARYEEVAKGLIPTMTMATNLSLCGLVHRVLRGLFQRDHRDDWNRRDSGGHPPHRGSRCCGISAGRKEHGYQEGPSPRNRSEKLSGCICCRHQQLRNRSRSPGRDYGGVAYGIGYIDGHCRTTRQAW